MLSRRAFVGKAAVGAAAAVALGAARIGIASTRPLSGTTDDPGGTTGCPGGAVADPADGHDAQNAPAPPADSAAAMSTPPPWDLLAPFGVGSMVAQGWRLADLSPVQDGSCVVTLQNGRGRSRRVHLCRNDGTPQGIVYTRRVDLVVMNEGHGDLPTEETLAQAVAELAHAVAANEVKVADRFFTDLLPHTERVRRFASAQGIAAEGKLR